jgi:hypothetical protein
VVVEGVVEPVADHGTIEEFTEWINAKYHTDIAVDFFSDNACFRLEPRKVFGLDESDFTGSPTRWTFGEGARSAGPRH